MVGWFHLDLGYCVFLFWLFFVCLVGLLLAIFLTGPLSKLYFFKSSSSTLQSNSPGAECDHLPGAARSGKPLVRP